MAGASGSSTAPLGGYANWSPEQMSCAKGGGSDKDPSQVGGESGESKKAGGPTQDDAKKADDPKQAGEAGKKGKGKGKRSAREKLTDKHTVLLVRLGRDGEIDTKDKAKLKKAGLHDEQIGMAVKSAAGQMTYAEASFIASKFAAGSTPGQKPPSPKK